MAETGAYVEVHRRGGRDFVVLTGHRIVLGRDADADVALTDDHAVSRAHAVLEPIGSGWSVRDLGSANGTTVNGERIWAERRLETGRRDPRRSVAARLPRGGLGPGTVDRTDRATPSLTPRERDVLVALCRPVLAADMFTEPASTHQIAETLDVSEAAVRQHLVHLYDKFDVYEGQENPRLRLANEAIRRGAVRLADLKGP